MSKFDAEKIWEGWKKELFWIAFFIVLFLMANAYHKETTPCREIKESICYPAWENCLFDETIKLYLKENPMAMVTDCNHTRKTCKFAGVSGPMIGFKEFTTEAERDNKSMWDILTGR